MRKSLTAIAMVSVAAFFCPMASAALVNYYSFNSQTMADEAYKYTQNVGANQTDGTMDDPRPIGTFYRTGIGSKYDPAETGDYALAIKGQYQAYESQAFTLPTGNADLNLGTNFTIEMWVHTGDSNTYGGHTYSRFMTAGNYSISTTSGNSQSLTVTGGTGLGSLNWNPTATWHHLALVFRPDDTYTYYWDGVASNSTYNTSTFGVTTIWQIGSGSTERYAANTTDVWIDDLAFWNTALTDSEIQAHKVAGGLGLILIPEPATLCLLGAGGVALYCRKRRR
ncbi:MAG: LamG-like jellyroll fold domain-containing protein [Planctomycetaceae bacterium]|nr:PEP-CTERM sorting domain-containing protein [Planctomycetaceae bacterium]